MGKGGWETSAQDTGEGRTELEECEGEWREGKNKGEGRVREGRREREGKGSLSGLICRTEKK